MNEPKDLWPAVARTYMDDSEQGVWIYQEGDPDSGLSPERIFIPWELWGHFKEMVERVSRIPGGE